MKRVSSSAHPVEIALRVALPVAMVMLMVYLLPLFAVLAFALFLVSPVLVFIWISRK